MKAVHDIEDQVRIWAEASAERIPPWTVGSLHRSARPRHRWVRAVAGAAAAAFVCGGTAIWLTRDEPQEVVTASPSSALENAPLLRQVAYERVEYRVTMVDLACPQGPLDGNSTSDVPVVFEAWADAEHRVWKNAVTPPDGGEIRELVATGSPWYPTELYVSQGVPTHPAIGCEDPDIGVLASQPGDSAFFSLNPLDSIPHATFGETSMPLVQRYDSHTERLADPATDSRGRPCTIWREDGSGFDGRGRAVSQRTDWCVEDSTGTVLERSFTNTVSGVGTTTTVLTLVDDEPKQVGEDFFATATLQPIPPQAWPTGG